MITDRPLIVSYSYSGNTQRIAQELQLITGGDRCDIHPWQPYPMAFPELLKQVKREIRSGVRPRLLSDFLSAHPYQFVFLGTPNWCGSIAPPLVSWLHLNELSGKIIFPFYSHCGGAAGNFQKEFAKLCPNSDVRDALGVIDDGGKNLTELLHQWFTKSGAAEFIPSISTFNV